MFNPYIDSKEHVAAIDDKVTISRKVGASFTASGGSAKSWMMNPDSILVLPFSKASRGG
ncbi:MAG TPA: hypothetical protein VF205_08395 [Nitrospiraceae bacterium]